MMAARKKTTTRKREKAHKFDKSHPWHRERDAGGHFAPRNKAAPEASAALTTSDEDLRRLERADPTLELGATGLKHYSGVIDEEFLPALRGQRAIQVFTEMKDNDATVGALLFAVEMLMRHVEWRIEPGGDQPIDHELAEFVDSCRADMAETWEDTLGSILSFLPFGFSVHEEVYKRRSGPDPQHPEQSSKHVDGRFGWKKLPVRAQDTVQRWDIDPATDALRAMVQLPPPIFRTRVIPSTRFMLFRTSAAKGNPQGRSVLRNAYRPWYYKRRIEEIEGIGVERDLAGLPKMEVPADIMARDAPPEKRQRYADIKQMLRDIRRDEREGIVVPREFDDEGNQRYAFELVRSGGRRQFDTTSIINRYDRHIASVALADFILLGQQRVGSFALIDNKTELFGFALGAWLDSIAQIFNRYGIPRLLLVNGIRVDKPPSLVHGEVETIDLTELGDYVAKLAGAGMAFFPDDDVENALRMQAGLPEKKPDEGPSERLTPDLVAAVERMLAEQRESEASPPAAPDDEGAEE